MKIIEKFAARQRDNWNQPPVILTFLGDSVTQGCFEVFWEETQVQTVFEQENSYPACLRRLLSTLYPRVPIAVINAGVSGSNAPHGLERLERDVLRHQPDLTVVSFGLNDAMSGMDGLQRYLDALEGIFQKLAQAQIETVFLAPNMMNTYVSCHLTNPRIREIAAEAAKIQNSGVLEAYLKQAQSLCVRHRIPVCDCYGQWKRLHTCGVDVTELLANRINHPTREMNWMLAASLAETLMQNFSGSGGNDI